LDTSKHAIFWLKEQLETQKEKLEKSELDLQKYLEENRITDLPKIEERGRLIDTLRQEEARMETQLAELSKRYKEKHPKMIRLIAELDSVKQKIQEETERTLKLNEIAIRYSFLKREVENNRELYNALLKRTKETGISEELTTTNIRVVDAAEVPDKPVKPKKRTNLLLGTFLGLFGGIFLSFFLEFIEDTVKTAEDIKEYLQAPFLGTLPSAKRETKTIQQIDLISHFKPKSMIAESYRVIRTEIFRNSQNEVTRTLLVTSTLPKEGKTTVATNLAIVLAQGGERVLLVEADTRRPRLKRTFNFDSPPGLCDYLTGKVQIDSIIQPTEIPNLKVIISGHTPDYPAELLNSAKMKEFLGIVKQKFERVIIDTPPILSVADSLILADNVDATIQIVKTDAVKKSSCLFAKQKLVSAEGKYVGAILNNIDLNRERYYYYYHYYRHYGEDKERKRKKTTSSKM
ncbi:MAG TPA: hypothetical protein DHV62_00385, partial [Elusimicrobia bacterium]|nr:hypothetical protein [Elusimicrobiota bacterium]